jgi:hypothetical protein
MFGAIAVNCMATLQSLLFVVICSNNAASTGTTPPFLAARLMNCECRALGEDAEDAWRALNAAAAMPAKATFIILGEKWELGIQLELPPCRR